MKWWNFFNRRNPYISDLRRSCNGDSCRIDLLEDAAKALVKIGAPIVRPLIAALKDDDNDWVQEKMIWALGEIGDERAVKPLIALLKVKGSDRARDAARALGKIGDARAVEPLIAALNQEDLGLCQSAARALGKIGDARAAEPLIAALNQGDPDLCQSAAWALGEIRDARAVGPLIAALEKRDCDWRGRNVHGNAVEALAKIGDVQTLSIMLKYRGTWSKSVVEFLRKILRESTAKIAIDDLRWISEMKDLTWRTFTYQCAFEIAHDENLDCCELRQLARQELIRRGVNV